MADKKNPDKKQDKPDPKGPPISTEGGGSGDPPGGGGGGGNKP